MPASSSRSILPLARPLPISFRVSLENFTGDSFGWHYQGLNLHSGFYSALGGAFPFRPQGALPSSHRVKRSPPASEFEAAPKSPPRCRSTRMLRIRARVRAWDFNFSPRSQEVAILGCGGGVGPPKGWSPSDAAATAARRPSNLAKPVPVIGPRFEPDSGIQCVAAALSAIRSFSVSTSSEWRFGRALAKNDPPERARINRRASPNAPAPRNCE